MSNWYLRAIRYLNGWTVHTFQKQRVTRWHYSMLSRAGKKIFNWKQRTHWKPLEIIIYGICQILTFCLFIMFDYKAVFCVTWSLNTVNSLQLFSAILSRQRFWIAHSLLSALLLCMCFFLRSLDMCHLRFNKTINLMSLDSAHFKSLIVQMVMEDAHLLFPATDSSYFTHPPLVVHTVHDIEPPHQVFWKMAAHNVNCATFYEFNYLLFKLEWQSVTCYSIAF